MKKLIKKSDPGKFHWYTGTLGIRNIKTVINNKNSLLAVETDGSFLKYA